MKLERHNSLFILKKECLFLLWFLLLVTSSSAFNNETRRRSWRPKMITSKQTSLFGYSISPEARMTSMQIISSRGYPARSYSVTTEDGYILEIHRIPYGINLSSDPSIKRRIVFLQHGLLGTDATWLLQPSNLALAFILADLGYDVWLGNVRGNTYSRKHTTLDPTKQDYWNFSPDEMGKYDVPAMINFILTTTGQSSLSYVGHSMGCAVFFIAMQYRPELNAKIDVMIALAPAAANGNSRGNIRLLAPFINPFVFFSELLGTTVYEPVDSIQHTWQKMYCGPNPLLRNTLCQNFCFFITSDGYDGIDQNLLPVIDGHIPAGTSLHSIAFYAQNYNARQTFQAYDFGSSGNQERYGQSTPLVYDLSKVTSPVYLYWGQNDKAVAPEDVAWLASRLGNMKGSNQVQDSSWNHGAHLFSPKAKQLVYDQFIPLLPPTPF